MKALSNSVIKLSFVVFMIFSWLIIVSALPAHRASPVVDIKAMDADGPVSVTSGTELSLSIGLDPGDRIDRAADWWIVALSGGQMQSLVYSVS